MKKADFKFIFASFLVWRASFYLILFFAIQFVPTHSGYLAGGYERYVANPYLWAFANFDGEHYLSIAEHGYRPLSYFFFPAYPMIVGFIGKLIGGEQFTYALVGQLISNLAIVVALVGLYKLVLLDYEKGTAKRAIIALLIFPTSFYFASVYTESIYLALTVWAFYFVRKSSWLMSGFFGAVSTATRVVGISILPSLMLESAGIKSISDIPPKFKAMMKIRNIFTIVRLPFRGNPLKVAGMAMVPMGLAAYMFYLWRATGDPFEFVTNVGIFGEQRSSTFILFPQVLYRYLFKILPAINYDYFPVVFTTYLEFVVGVVFFVISIILFWKIRLSYAVFNILVFLIPTLSGSFSSLPRYVLACFPIFIYFSILSLKASRKTNIILGISSIVLLAISFSLFARGYWLS